MTSGGGCHRARGWRQSEPPCYRESGTFRRASPQRGGGSTRLGCCVPSPCPRRCLHRLPGPCRRPAALGLTPAARTGSRPPPCPHRGPPSAQGLPGFPFCIAPTRPTVGTARVPCATEKDDVASETGMHRSVGRTPVSCRMHPSFPQDAPRLQQHREARGASWNRREPGWWWGAGCSGRNPSCPPPPPAPALSTWVAIWELQMDRWWDRRPDARTCQTFVNPEAETHTAGFGEREWNPQPHQGLGGSAQGADVPGVEGRMVS